MSPVHSRLLRGRSSVVSTRIITASRSDEYAISFIGEELLRNGNPLPSAMGLIYKPFGIIIGILAGLLGKRLFNFTWDPIDDEHPPKANHRGGGVGRRCWPLWRFRA